MKKLLLTLLMAVMGITAWAGDVVYKTALFGSSYNSRGVSAYNASWSATNNGFTVNLVNWNNNNNGWSYIKAGNKSTAYVATITNANAIDKAVTKIAVTIDAVTANNINNIKLYTGDAANSCTTEIGNITVATGVKEISLPTPAANKFYKLSFDCKAAANGSVQVSKVQYYVSDGGASAPKYSVNIAGGITHGSVSADPTQAEADATVSLTATPDAGYMLSSWTVTNATTSESITVTDDQFTMPAADVNVSATFTAIPEKTIADFIEAEGGKCYLTGIVSNIANTTYGNFDLTDESGTIYVYGCLTSAGESRQFASLGVVAGDKIKVLANEYELFDEKHEAKNVIFVEEIEIPKTQYTVTIETPENGTLVVKEGETVLTSGDEVEEGKTLTVECTPAAGYRYQNWQYKEGGNWVTMTSTMTRVVTQDISIRANFELIPTYTIAFSVNGSIVKSEELQEGADVTAPADPEDINGKVFTGWVTTESVVADATPAYVTPAATATADVTYYAVFATATAGGESQTNIIDYNTENIPSSYAASADVVLNGVTFNVTQMYKNGEKMQWRAAGNSNGTGAMYNQTAIVGIQSITILYDNSDTYKNFTVKVGNTVNPTEGTNITPSLNGNLYTFDCSAINPSFFVLTNGTNAGYLKEIKITYGGGTTYSDFTTTVATTATISLNAACTDGDLVYGTYSNASAWVVSDDIEVSEIAVVDGELMVVTYAVGAVVPANTGVMVSALEGGDYVVNLSNEAGTSVLGNDNCLHPSSEVMTGDNLFYRLTMHNGTQIGFWWGAADGAAFCLGANKAYLAVPKSSAGAPAQVWFTESETAISEINVDANSNVMYDLQGRKSNGKGLMIQNGKVVLVK